MRLIQISIEIIRPKESTDLIFKLFSQDQITKQQIRRGLVRLFWKFEDILIDYPKGHNVLGQILAYLKLRGLLTGKIVTQIPLQTRELLFKVDSFTQSFEKEIKILAHEKEYKEKAINLIKHYYYNFDLADIKTFFSEEVKAKGWEQFNNFFLRKAIDIAMDLDSNDKEACQKLLFKCTHEFNFGNMDFGYAFDFLLWVTIHY